MNSETYAAAPPEMGGLFSPQMAQLDDWRSIGHDADPFEDEEEDYTDAAPVAIELRPYQKTAVDKVVAAHKNGFMAPLVSSATGTGKSFILAAIAKHYQARGVLVLVHRDELIKQLAESCGKMGLPVGIEKAEKHGLNGFRISHNIVIASVQTLNKKRLETWALDSFGLILIDECHRSISPSYANVFRHFGWTPDNPQGGPLMCGLTATPDRADGKNIGALFDTLAFEYSIRNAVKNGDLVPPKVLQLKTTPAIDLRGLRLSGKKDFDPAELEEIVIANLDPMVNALAQCEQLKGRRTIGFFPEIESSRLVAIALEKVGISANYVSGACPDRAEKIQAHKNGEFQVLCNSMLATEGYDDRQVSAIIFGRPTKSRGLKCQMGGRATRLHPESGKTDCLWIDFDWQIDDTTLTKAVDLFNDHSIADEVMEIAREIEDEEKSGDIEEILERAHLIHGERLRERIRKQKIPMRGKMFDPLGLAEFFDIPVAKQGYEWNEVRGATERQRDALIKWGIAAPANLPFAVATSMLDKIIGRAKNGWADMRTVASLIEAGVDGDTARGLRKDEARAQLTEINSAIPASSGQLYVLQSKYDYAPPGAMTKAEASAMLGKFKRERGE